jgi:succinyl-CoA synthetase beta subunit
METELREEDAAQRNLNFVQQDGNIGCLVNGAGLAMAIMDIIKLYGGEPANFLDVEGSVQEHQVTEDDKVKAILVNVFGGLWTVLQLSMELCLLVHHDEGKLKLLNSQVNIPEQIPLIVRLEGTNVDNAKAIIENSGLAITSASDLDDAVKALA